MRFEVPQFIEIEDKIIGPFTWKQFVYLAGGVGILLILYFLIPSFIIFVIVGLPFGALSASLAFQTVNNRPFSFFLESFVNYLTKKKLYLWRKDVAQTVAETADTPDLVASNFTFTKKKSINSLSRKLELRLPNQ